MRRVSAVCYGLTLLFAIPNMLSPIDGNTSIFDYVGRGWLDGYWPYESAVDHKPPGVFILYALVALLFSKQEYGIRIAELASVLMIGHILGRLVSCRDPRVRDLGGIAALLVASFYYTAFDYFATGGPEIWEALFLVAAWWRASTVAASKTRNLCCGVLGALAFMFKFPAALPFAGIVSILLMRLRADGLPLLARLASMVTVGFAGTMTLLCLPFLATGRGSEMWEAAVSFNSFYATMDRFPEQSPPEWFWTRHVLVSTVIMSLASLAAVIQVFRTRQWQALIIGAEILVLGCLSIVSVIAQGKYLHYHWAIVTPFVAAAILWGIIRTGDGDTRVTVLLVSACVLATLLMTPSRGTPQHPYVARYLDQFNAAWNFLTGNEDRERYVSRYRSTYYPYGDVKRLGAIVNRLKGPDDTLCTHSTFAPSIYTITRLRCSSRFFADHVLWYIMKEPRRARELSDWIVQYDRTMADQPPTFLLVSWSYTQRYWGHQYLFLASASHLTLLTRRD